MRFFSRIADNLIEVRQSLLAEGGFYAKLLGSSVVGILAITALALMFLLMAVRDHQRDRMQAQTLEVLRLSSKLENDIANIEANLRGFLVTGKQDYEINFGNHGHVADRHTADLKIAVAATPRQSERVAKVEASVNRWVTEVASAQIAARKKGEESAGTVSAGGLLDEARVALRELQADEQKRLNAKAKEESATNQSFQILVSTPKLASVAAEIEKAEWDYLLTGDKRALDSYKKETGEFYAIHGYLWKLLEEEKLELAQLDHIKQLLEQWQSQAALPEITAKQQGKDVAAVIAQGKGRGLLKEIHSAINKFEQDQVAKYEAASAKADLHRVAKAVGSALLCVLAIGFLIASSWYSFAAYRRHLKTMKSAEAQTRLIIETTLDGVITVDPQGYVQSMNPAAEKMFGHPAANIINQPISTLIPQRLFMHEIMKLGRGTLMAIGQRQNYYPFPIEISLSEMHTQGRKQYVAVIRDVTERKRSEETLKHIGLGVSNSTGEEFVRSLIKQLSKALCSDFAFIVEVIRKGSETITQLSIAEEGTIRSRQNYNLTNTACDEVMKKGYRAYQSGVREKFPHDEILQELRAESFLAMPLVDHRGRAIGLMGVIDRNPMEEIQIAESTLQIFAGRAGAEIERKRFEEDLAAEKERLAVTLRSIGDGFITIDEDGRILLVNKVAEKLTGWTQEEASGKPLSEVFHILNERTRKPSQAAIQAIVETGSVVGSASSAVIVARDGSERLIESTASPIRDRLNRRIGVVLVFRDITERAHAEEERRKAEKLESLGVAAGGIAHDFNNILTAIIGNLSLSLLTSDDPEMTERLGTAKKAAMRAQDLAQQLLTFARGGAPIKKAASISQFIKETAENAVREDTTRVEFEIEPNLWPVEVDSGQIGQVINNIMTNAEQAMPAGGTVTVTCHNFHLAVEDPSLAALQPGKYVRIIVQDEGIGIPEEYIKKIFDPYFTTKPKGSGLGLATAYSIIKNHQGQITVHSKPGNGSTFAIYLPATESEVPAERTAVQQVPVGSRKILVMDDEEAICALVTHALTPLGYTVTESNDAGTALTLYQQALSEGRKYDAVIMDLTIPGGMGGQEAVKKMRQMDPNVKAIVSSGYAMDPVMSRYKEYGFIGCIAKPYEIEELGSLVQEIVSSSDDGENVVYHEFMQTQLA
jgi:PAS domain S-box-containing protein